MYSLVKRLMPTTTSVLHGNISRRYASQLAQVNDDTVIEIRGERERIERRETRRLRDEKMKLKRKVKLK